MRGVALRVNVNSYIFHFSVHHGLGWPVWLGITVACVGLFIIIIIIVFIM